MKPFRFRALALVLMAMVPVGCADGGRPSGDASSRSPVREVWRWTAPPPAYAGMPAADHDGIALTYGQTWLVLLDASGRARWTAGRQAGLRDVAPLLTPDLVVAATESGLAAYERGDGRLRWEADLGDRANSPVSAGGTVVASTWDGDLAAVGSDRGEPVWRTRLPGGTIGPPAAAGDVVVTTWEADDGSAAGALAVGAATGGRRWEVGLEPGGVSAPVISPAVSGAQGPSGPTERGAQGPSGPTERGAQGPSGPTERGAQGPSGPTERGGGGVAVVVAGDLAAHGLALDTGTELWTADLEGAGSPEVPPLALGGGEVLVAHRLGGMVLVDGSDGEVRWRVSSDGAAVQGGPAGPGPDGWFALPLDDGRVVLAGPGRATSMLDPPGRVSGVVTGPDGSLLVAGREADENGLTASTGW